MQSGENISSTRTKGVNIKIISHCSIFPGVNIKIIPHCSTFPEALSLCKFEVCGCYGY